MRTFHSKGVTIQVSTADLAMTTAASFQATSSQIEQIARAFVEGSQKGTLFGTALSSNSENQDQGLQFLGEDESIPFYLLHVGKDFFNIKATENRSIRPKRMPDGSASSSPQIETVKPEGIDPPQRPHAVSLNVFLSPESFQPYMKSRLAPDEQDSLRDIKIDVYFNGALLSSKVVAKKHAADEFLNSELIVRFTGLPIGEQIEQALIFVPPGQNPDGSLRANKKRKESALQRWQEISERLSGEAQTLLSSGESAILAKGVRDLASLTIPKDVERMRTNQRIFSTLDVFVTSGSLTDREAVAPPRPFIGKTADVLPSGRPIRRSRLAPGYAYTSTPRKKTTEEQFQELERNAQLAIADVIPNSTSLVTVSNPRKVPSTKETKTTTVEGPRGLSLGSAAPKPAPFPPDTSSKARGSKRKHSPTPPRRVLFDHKTDERAFEESPGTTTSSILAVLDARQDKFNEGAALTVENYFRPTGDQPIAPAGFLDDVIIGIVRCVFY